VDGSTSTLPIERIVACKILDAFYEWRHSAADDTRSVEASDNYDYFMTPGYKGEKKELCNFINRITKHAGTHESYVKLIQGKADLILVARGPSEDELALAKKSQVELEPAPIALDGFVFLINAKNPVQALTLEQIREIYSGKVRNWKDFGGMNVRIQAYQRSRNSGSQETMKQLVMNGRSMISGPDVLVETLMSMTVLRIGEDQSGIAYSFYYYQELMADYAGVRACAINGVSPTAETIRNRTYPLVTEVFAVTRRDSAADHSARRLRDWLLTPAGQQVIAETEYVPLTDIKPAAEVGNQENR